MDQPSDDPKEQEMAEQGREIPITGETPHNDEAIELEIDTSLGSITDGSTKCNLSSDDEDKNTRMKTTSKQKKKQMSAVSTRVTRSSANTTTKGDEQKEQPDPPTITDKPKSTRTEAKENEKNEPKKKEGGTDWDVLVQTWDDLTAQQDKIQSPEKKKGETGKSEEHDRAKGDKALNRQSENSSPSPVVATHDIPTPPNTQENKRNGEGKEGDQQKEKNEETKTTAEQNTQKEDPKPQRQKRENRKDIDYEKLHKGKGASPLSTSSPGADQSSSSRGKKAGQGDESGARTANALKKLLDLEYKRSKELRTENERLEKKVKTLSEEVGKEQIEKNTLKEKMMIAKKEAQEQVNRIKTDYENMKQTRLEIEKKLKEIQKTREKEEAEKEKQEEKRTEKEASNQEKVRELTKANNKAENKIKDIEEKLEQARTMIKRAQEENDMLKIALKESEEMNDMILSRYIEQTENVNREKEAPKEDKAKAKCMLVADSNRQYLIEHIDSTETEWLIADDIYRVEQLKNFFSDKSNAEIFQSQDAIIIMQGTNDVRGSRGFPVKTGATTYKIIEQTVNALPNDIKEKILIAQVPPQIDRGADLEAAVLNNRIKNNIPEPIGKIITQECIKGYPREMLLRKDGFHLSDEGAKLIAREINKAVTLINKQTTEEPQRETIEIPRELTRHVIGKKGAEIQRIKEKFGVKIKIENKRDNETQSTVCVEGDPNNTTKTIEYIRDLISNVQRKKEQIPVCKYYIQGKCKFGKNCRYIHKKPDDVPDQTPQSTKKDEEKQSRKRQRIEEREEEECPSPKRSWMTFQSPEATQRTQKSKFTKLE